MYTQIVAEKMFKKIIQFNPKIMNRGLSSDSSKRFKAIGPAGYIFLVAPATTFCLGVWQYNRRQWKINLIDELQEKVRKSEPEPLKLNEVEGVEYKQVSVIGQFDNTKEIIIGPRSFIDAKGEAVGGGIISARDSRVGFLVVSPFVISGSGQRILVNRGWIPRNKIEKVTRVEGDIEGETTISGVLRLTEEKSSMSPANNVNSNMWHSRDVDQLAKKLETLPLFLDIDLESSKEAAMKGGPVGGQTRISLRNDHVQYMMTWWSISAITLILWFKKFVFK